MKGERVSKAPSMIPSFNFSEDLFQYEIESLGLPGLVIEIGLHSFQDSISSSFLMNFERFFGN